MKLIMKWFNRIFLKKYYKLIVGMKQDRCIDSKGMREILILILECEHEYWIEIPENAVVAGMSKYLCDSCFKAAMVRKDAQEAVAGRGGRNRWDKWWWRWTRMMKGVDRRLG